MNIFTLSTPRWLTYLLLLCAGLTNTLSAQTIRYVRTFSAGNGATWGGASNNLQSMINASSPGDEVWVGAGLYQPLPGTSFVMKEGVKIYGGFPDTGTPTKAQRDWIVNATVLSGNGNSVVRNIDNALTSAALLDGFTIRNGSTEHLGGGIFNDKSSPALANLIIQSNNAVLGGGMANRGAAPSITNVIIRGNTTIKDIGGFGGGIYNGNANPVLTNVVITGNYAFTGSAIYNNSSSPVITNATVSGNYDQLYNGAGCIYNVSYSNLVLRNSVVWNNLRGIILDSGSSSDITYSLVQGQGANEYRNNMDGNTNPLFGEPENPGLSVGGNYTLKTESPLSNKGNNACFSNGQTPDLSAIITDMVGTRRIQGLSVDIGAYEIDLSGVTVRYVKQGGTGNGYSWSDASGDLQKMIAESSENEEVWVAAGTYLPAAGESFSMKEGVKIYGGFPEGGFPGLAQRNWAANVSALQGNGSSVIHNSKLSNAALLDGFLITGGNAYAGGGISNDESSPSLFNLVVTGNIAGYRGGGIHNDNNSSPVLVNVSLYGNMAEAAGGIHNASHSSPVMINSTIADPVYNTSGSLPVFRNSIIWATVENDAASFPSYNYCIVKDLPADADRHNLDGTRDPRFADPALGNYALKPGSFAINAGNNDYLSAGLMPDISPVTHDLAGNSRIRHTLVDIGAYEYAGDINIRYVVAGKTGNGTSWETASGDLQAMIDQSEAGNEIWVAAGTYQPATGKSFSMKEGVKLYGGFLEKFTWLERNWRGISAVLKGNGSSVIFNNNNGLTPAAVLDGFYVTGGSGAISGGGIRNLNASPTFNNVIIHGNEALMGAGISNEFASPVLTHVYIRGNSTVDMPGGNGGGMYNYQSAPVLTNVLINGNRAYHGGAIYNSSASPILTNVTVAANLDTAPDGGAVYNAALSQPNIRNTVIANNSHGLTDQSGSVSAIYYSLVQGQDADPENHNLGGSVNPLFVKPLAPGLNEGGDYDLQVRSPVVNMGNNGYFAPGLTPDLSGIGNDIVGDFRIQSTAVDMGAFEVVLELIPVTPRYVRQGGTGNGYSWENASGDLQTMINESWNGHEVWVAEGTYQPASGQSFSMKEGVKILGGFPSEGTPALVDRDWVAHVTTLQGNGSRVIANDRNGLGQSALLDGFTITGGNHPGGGGAIYNRTTSPTLSNLVIQANTSPGKGGAIWNNNASPVVRNTLIAHNTASYGAAAFNEQGSQPVFVNCTITANAAFNGACGGINTGGANSISFLKNTIVYNNTFDSAIDGTSNIRNEAGGTADFSHSLVQGSGGSGNWIPGYGNDAGNNVDRDPFFTDAPNGDYTLLPVSFAVNNGDTGAFENAGTQKDLSGRPRVHATRIDMGAYEYDGPVVPHNNILYVKKGATGTGSGWGDALGEVAHALKFAKEQDGFWSEESAFQIWAAGGTYKPLYSPADNNFGHDDGRHNAFRMVEHVKVYGGFAGTEAVLEDRDRSQTANASVLSGDLNGDDEITETDNVPTTFAHTDDNTYHVVVAAGSNSERLSANTVLDGFTVSGGNAKTAGDGVTVQGYKLMLASGGGLYNLYSDMMMSNLVVSYNAGSNGGGVYNHYSSPKIEDVSFTKNYGEWGGGMFNFYSSPKIGNGVVDYNLFGGNGGGIYNHASSPSLTDVRIRGNRSYTTNSYGGGMHSRESDGIRLRNVLLENNSAYHGGAISNDKSTITIEHSILRGNRATYDGGGIYSYSSETSLTNSLVTGNRCDYTGGGVYNAFSRLNIRNSTISGNKAEMSGGGVNTRGGSLIVENTIIYGNNSGIHSQEGTTVSIKNSDIQDNASNENGNINQDPLFTNAPSYSLAPFSSGDYTLLPCSPVINKGNNSLIPAGVETDLNGNPRIYGETVDMGAYELPSDALLGAEKLALDGAAATVEIQKAGRIEVKADDDACRSIMAITTKEETTALKGEVAISVHIDETVQFHHNAPYVQRYYDIMPAANASTATADVTLYFTQEEFDAFNHELSAGGLPASSDDASGKSNLRVYQFHGSSVNGTNPSGYAGALTILDPADENIVWNEALERWEVKFDVTGFSGFFVGSANSPLPVTLVSFEGKRNDAGAVELVWKVTEQVNIARYEVEYSPNGKDFIAVGSVTANDSDQTSYRFTDSRRNGPVAYYRLRVVEQDGSYAFSRIVSMALPTGDQLAIYPVPARDYLWIEGVGLKDARIRIIDLQGRVVKTFRMQSDKERIGISWLPTGIYFIITGDSVTKKFIKE